MILLGPDLYNSMISVIWKIQNIKKIVFSWDVKEMFSQINMTKEDLPAKTLLWRKDEQEYYLVQYVLQV